MSKKSQQDWIAISPCCFTSHPPNIHSCVLFLLSTTSNIESIFPSSHDHSYVEKVCRNLDCYCKKILPLPLTVSIRRNKELSATYLARKYAGKVEPAAAGSRKCGWLSQNKGGTLRGFWIIVIRGFFLSFIHFSCVCLPHPKDFFSQVHRWINRRKLYTVLVLHS